MRWIVRQNLLVSEQAEVRPTDLLVVPAAGMREQLVSFGRRERVAARRLGDCREHFAPDLPLAGGKPFDLVRVLAYRWGLAQRAHVSEDALLRIVELARAQAADLGEKAGPLLAMRGLLASNHERLDHFSVFAERLSDLVQGSPRDLVFRVAFYDGGVDALGALLVVQARLENARRAK